MSEITDLIGKPFSEMKCWDLVQEYYRRNGKRLPDYRELLTTDGAPDGGNQLLHATEGGVCIERFSKFLPRLKGMYK